MASTDASEEPVKPVRLDDFRNALIRQEETIIFALIERAQFPRNRCIYTKRHEPGSVEFGGLRGKYDAFQGSFLDFMFIETEKLHALVRRYASPDENAFYPQLLPEPVLPHLNYSQVLHPNRINVNDQIMNVYLEKILPGLTEDLTDATTVGSTATADIAVLQALSKRIHYGKFIAEAKFQAERERYTDLILRNDAQGLMDELTKPAVEEKLLRRVRLKASTYGQDIHEDANAPVVMNDCKVDPLLISDLYRDFVMPLTKEVEVQYLLQRLAHPSVSIAAAPGSFCWNAALQHFPSLSNEHMVTHDSIGRVFEDVASNKTAFGIVPIDDSQAGAVKETHVQLLHHSLSVCAEVLVTKRFVLATRAKQAEISTVAVPTEAPGALWTHAEQSWPSAHIVSVASVTEAADLAAHETGTVAVTTSSAAQLHHLELVETSTLLSPPASAAKLRCVVIAKTSPPSTGRDKTFVSMEIKDEVGSLMNALGIWKAHDVNLCCLESLYRPQCGGYDFFVELLGHSDDPNVKQAIAELRANVCVVKHLGSFPIAKEELQLL